MLRRAADIDNNLSDSKYFTPEKMQTIKASVMNLKKTCKMTFIRSRIILGGWRVSRNTITV